MGMKHTFILLTFLIITSCAHKTEVHAPNFLKAGHYAYVEDDDGRVYIITNASSHLDEAMKRLHPGPASIDKLDLYVITPLNRKKPATQKQAP